MQNESDTRFTPATGGSGTDRQRGGEGDDSTPTGDLGASRGEHEDHRMHEAASRVKEQASDVRERAVDEVEERATQQKQRAADSLGTVARSLRTAGDQLPADNGMSRYIYQAASQMENLAHVLETRDISEMVDEVEDFARRQPTAFIGGAFALGVVGGRFLRSSRRGAIDGESRDAGYSDRDPTARIDEPRDAVSRPMAPGYAPPGQREDTSGDRTGEYR